MRPAGRIRAAMEIVADIESRRRPAGQVLSDWGKNNRFAGSKDRSAIGNIVYDTLRNRSTTAWRMGEETARALVLGTLSFHWKETSDNLASLFKDDVHAPDPLTEAEIQSLEQSTLNDAPDWVKANIPEWLASELSETFEEELVSEGIALSQRPPTDIRVNTIKADRDKVAKSLDRFGPQFTALSPLGLRFSPAEREARNVNVLPEPGYQKGWFEIQDEGSQLASLLLFAQPGEQILDYCAGSGGKTLALSQIMENKGQIFAYDSDRTRLAPIHERLKRAGTRNVQVRSPGNEKLDDLKGSMHRVIVDAPCSGSGIWRRRPETKWRLTPESLENRQTEQRNVLLEAAPFVRPGGYLCYITCSIIPSENEMQIYIFLEENQGFELVSAGEVWEELVGESDLKPWSMDGNTLTMTPASTGTDGFFFGVLERTGESL